jgi:glyoxylate reductase
VTRRLAPGVIERLAEATVLDHYDSDRPMPREEFLARSAGQHGVLTTLSDVVDAEFLDAAGPQLRVVSHHAVGHHTLDIAACAARGVTVTNTPGVLTAATADLAMALLLGAARRIGEGERWIRAGRPWTWAPDFLLGIELQDARLGILGLGRIGRAIAARAAPFGMRIAYHNRRPVPDRADLTYLDLPGLLDWSEILVISCPLTSGTRGLIDAERLALLPESAVVVTVTAGVLDEGAAADALEAGRLAAVAIDHHTDEPQVCPRLLAHDRALLTPHLGSATVRTRRAMGDLAVDDLLAVLAGRPPRHPVTTPHPPPTAQETPAT